MKLTVDRIEENIAVLEKEDLTHIEVSLALLPDGIKEGSILRFDGANYTQDTDEELERKRLILEKQSLLFKRTKKD